ncbi:MAG: peptidylprolyl isomerase [Phycisphaeraceae bacterium]|nr:peptidylprolyl isomerase [Phycisphaeraceae bacterium]
MKNAKFFLLLLVLAAGWLATPAAAVGGRDIVHLDIIWFDPSQGYVFARTDLLLYNDLAPNTVANFENYITSNRYELAIIHRLALYSDNEPFVVQTGGFGLDGGSTLIPYEVEEYPAINSEFNAATMSNIRGTLSMARIGNDENSATSQWFINMSDRNTFLDAPTLTDIYGQPILDEFGQVQHAVGFTVFGKVIETDTLLQPNGNAGMGLIDSVASLPTFDFSSWVSAFSELPLLNYTQADYLAGNPLSFGKFIYIVPTIDPDVTIGDVNADGNVTLSDIEPFRQALAGSSYVVRADMDQSGVVTLSDIEGFKSVLTSSGGSPAAVPEPGLLGVLAVAGLAMACRRNRA